MKLPAAILTILFLLTGLSFATAQDHTLTDDWTDLDLTEFYSTNGDQLVAVQLDETPRFHRQAVMTAFKEMRYPSIARQKGIEGTVKIRVSLDERGQYIRAVPVSTIGAGCDEEALYSVQRIIRAGVTPAILGGHPTAITFDIPVKFSFH